MAKGPTKADWRALADKGLLAPGTPIPAALPKLSQYGRYVATIDPRC